MNKKRIALLLTAVLLLSGLPVRQADAGEPFSDAVKEVFGGKALNASVEKEKKEASGQEDVDIVRDSKESGEDAQPEEKEPVAERQILEIATVEEFIGFAQQCHLDAWSYDKQIELKADLDLSGVEFEPVPVFDGVFKGNGHTISGFVHTGSGYVSGLFRYIGRHGQIENLTLHGSVSSEDEKKCVGGLCGINEGVIKGCKFKGNVSGKTETGGIAGSNQASGVIENCVTEGRIIGYYYTGGVAGKNYGNIVSCINHSNINDNSAWVEEDDQSGGLSWFRAVEEGEGARLHSGVDTGGITGYSSGVVVSCSNTGTVGYEHTGYNIGGIAGRQAGLLSSCSNKGTVYGRKDVGGIVGQMEPCIRLNQAESVTEEIQKLHDLIDKALDDMGEAEDALSGDFDRLVDYSDGALNKSHAVVSGMSGFVDDNVDAVNQAADRLEHVMDRLPDVLDPFSDSLADIKASGESIRKLKDGLDIIRDMEIKDYDETDYQRLSLITGIGGTLAADNRDPAKGAYVAVTAQPSEGYTLKSLSVVTAAGNPVETTGSGNAYRFVMPEENVRVLAEFDYAGAYLAASSAGGQVAVREEEDTVSIGISAYSDYRLSALSIGGKTAEPGGGSITVSKAEYPADGKPALVYAEFERNTETDGDDSVHSVMCAGGTGGSLTAESKTGTEGEEIRLVSVIKSGYRMKKLKITCGGTEIPYTQSGDSAYLFTMPEGDVVAEAEYEPVRFYMTSNAGGDASGHTTVSGNVIRFTVNPRAGYTLSTDPEVTDNGGGRMPVSRLKAGSYEYEVKTLGSKEPVKAEIKFEGQKQSASVQEAFDRIEVGMEELTGTSDRAAQLLKEIRNIAVNADGTVKDFASLTNEQKDALLKDIMELSEELSAAGGAAASILSNISMIQNVAGPYLSQTAEETGRNIEELITHIQNAVGHLSESTAGIKGIVGYLNGQKDINFAPLGEDFNRNVDDLYTELQGIQDSMKTISGSVSQYSDLLNEDFRAVNDQLNVVLLLFIDRMEQLEHPRTRTIYEDVSDEDIEESIQGKVTQCINRGVVQGDINIGGVAGSLSIDEEDPEENAAGSVEFSLGNTYLTKCILSDCKNYGYITAKKDGAGCIAGYMNLGVIAGCEAYGGAKSAEGDYVGGICGQSLAVIQKCYSLCSLSGGRYVGGIAGYADAVNNCYAMSDVQASSGRAGAIAGQAASREEEELLLNIRDNFYVEDALYGIDDISYIGVAEPVTYGELLAVEGLPADYRHLKVTFVAEDKLLGTQELRYAESLKKLQFPPLENKDNKNGVWPDVSDRRMKGNLVLTAEYEDNITVVKSEEEGEEAGKALALAEGEYTGKTKLRVMENTTQIPPRSVVKTKEYTVYDIALEDERPDIKEVDLRLLKKGEGEEEVWQYKENKWIRRDTKTRGRYMQLTMEGKEGTFCIVYGRSGKMAQAMIIVGAVLAAALLLLLYFKKFKKKKK